MEAHRVPYAVNSCKPDHRTTRYQHFHLLYTKVGKK